MYDSLIVIVFLTNTLGNPTSNTTIAPTKNTTTSKPSFKDFIEKYEPSTVWDQIDRQKAIHKRRFTRKEEFNMFFRGIDPTDELLSLPVENGDVKILLEKSARRWRPPGQINKALWMDRYSLRFRMVELMKQAIYQARNKMIIMQQLREEKRKNALYKMGFLFAKTDLTAKLLASFATKSFRACSMKRQNNYRWAHNKYHLLDLVHTHERLMQIWFDLDLLVDMLKRNDYIGHKILEKYSGPERVKAFNSLFED